MFNPEYIKSLVENSIGNYVNLLIAFLLIVFLAINAKNMAVNWIIGIFIKIKKKHQVGDVFIYGNDEWKLIKLNGIGLTFQFIISKENGKCTTSKRTKERQYIKFISSDIDKTGEKY